MSANAKDLAGIILKFLESHGAVNELGDVISQLQEYYERNVRKSDVAIVKTANPLSITEQTEILVELKEVFKKDLRIEMIVDESVVGGIKIQVGDVVIDRTLKTKLNEIKSVLLK